VAQKLLTPLTIKNLSSPGSDAVTVFVNGEAYGRLKIEAGGRMSWSDGTGTHDTNLYRESADTLTTDDIFKALTALVSPITSGAPSANVPNGAIAVDNLNNRLYFRSNSTWRVVQGGATVSANAPDSPLEGALWFDTDDSKLYIRQGNAWVLAGGGGGSSVTVSDSEPASPSVGNLWYESDTGKMFIYYDSFWVEVSGDTGPQGPAGPTGANISVSSNSPASPTEGSLWFDSDTAQTFVYYDSQWVEIGASAMAATVSADAPVSPISGQIWLDSDTGGVYVYYSNVWIEVGAVPQLTSAAITTALGYTPANSSTAATTGKAIAMSIVFGG